MSAEKDEKKGGSQTGKRDQREATCTRPVEFYHQGQGGILGIRPNPSEGEGPGRCRCQAFSCWTVRTHRTPRERAPGGDLGYQEARSRGCSSASRVFQCFYSQHCPPSSISAMSEGLVKQRRRWGGRRREAFPLFRASLLGKSHE